MTSVAAVSAAYLSGLAMSLALAVGARMPSHLELLVLLVPLAVPLALVRPGLASREARVWQAAWLLGAGAMLWLTLSAALPPRPYGDGDIFTQFVAEGRVVPRWLVGSALASWGHALIWEFPPVATRLPLAIATPAGYLVVLCTLTLCGGSVWLLQRWPRRLAVLLPTLTPVWFLLGSGYVEYYPLVAPVFVGVLAWLFEAPLEQRDARHVGLVAGALAVVYVAFAPIGVLILAALRSPCGRGRGRSRPHRRPARCHLLARGRPALRAQPVRRDELRRHVPRTPVRGHGRRRRVDLLREHRARLAPAPR